MSKDLNTKEGQKLFINDYLDVACVVSGIFFALINLRF